MKFQNTMKSPIQYPVTHKTNHDALRITLSPHQGYLRTTQWEMEKL